jgi:2-aminoadipate transaminase
LAIRHRVRSLTNDILDVDRSDDRGDLSVESDALLLLSPDEEEYAPGDIRGLMRSFAPPGVLPAYRELSDFIEAAVYSGDLALGSRLPSERTFATWIGMSRTTVQTAYQYLESKGLVETRPNVGTIITSSYKMPKDVATSIYRRAFAKRDRVRADRAFFDLMRRDVRFDRYGFDVGMPDHNLLRYAELELVTAELFESRRDDLFGYGEPQGLLTLREHIVTLLARYRGIENIGPEHVLITNGSMQALNLIASAFVEPGDVVGTEDPTWPGAPHVFSSHGARVVGLPIDGEGLIVREFEHLIAKRDARCKLIYVQPTLQNPTGVVMSDARREALRQSAASGGVIIVEDDAYGIFDSTPGARSLFADRRTRPALYVGTFSKFLAPGLRIGFIAADPGVIDHLTSLKQLDDLHTSSFTQLLVDAWLTMTDVDAYVRASRATYASRLATALGDPFFRTHATIPVAPAGDGYYLYGEFAGDRSARSVRDAAQLVGVSFGLGDSFAVSRPARNSFRLSFGRTSENAIRAGLLRLSRVLEGNAVPATRP